MVRQNTPAHHSVPDHLGWSLLAQLFCCHPSTLLRSLHLLPHQGDEPIALSPVQCRSLIDCNEDMCRKAVRRLRFFAYATLERGPYTPLMWPLTCWFDFSAHPQTCLLTGNLLAIWALAWAWLLTIGCGVLKHLPAFFPLHPFLGCLCYFCLLGLKLTTSGDTWGVVYMPPSNY